MASLAALISALFLATFVMVAWRARALALREVQRASAGITRTRELEEITADGASLLYAVVLSIEHARELLRTEPETSVDDARANVDEARATIDEAHQAIQALASLFTAGRSYVSGGPDLGVRRGEGCVRVAVAVARSRGCRIALRGGETDLALVGAAREACGLLIGLLEAASATLEPSEHVEVTLRKTEVTVRGGSKALLEIADRDALASALGLRVAQRGRNLLVIQSDGDAGPDTGERERVGSVENAAS